MISATSYRGVASKPYSLSTLPWRGRRLITPGNLARKTNFQVLHYEKMIGATRQLAVVAVPVERVL